MIGNQTLLGVHCFNMMNVEKQKKKVFFSHIDFFSPSLICKRGYAK